jgi:hypothetical protein
MQVETQPIERRLCHIVDMLSEQICKFPIVQMGALAPRSVPARPSEFFLSPEILLITARDMDKLMSQGISDGRIICARHRQQIQRQTKQRQMRMIGVIEW